MENNERKKAISIREWQLKCLLKVNKNIKSRAYKWQQKQIAYVRKSIVKLSSWQKPGSIIPEDIILPRYFSDRPNSHLEPTPDAKRIPQLSKIYKAINKFPNEPLKAYNYLLPGGPKNFKTFENLARVYAYRGEPSKVTRLWEKIYGFDDKSAYFEHKQGGPRHIFSKKSETIRYYKGGLLLAKCYALQMKYGNALKLLAGSEDGAWPRLFMKVGILANKLGDYEAALKSLQKALKTKSQTAIM